MDSNEKPDLPPPYQQSTNSYCLCGWKLKLIFGTESTLLLWLCFTAL